MENINTALLTRYLEAQDTIKQLLNERQIYQDKIDNLTIRLRSTMPNNFLIDAYYHSPFSSKECAEKLGILNSTVKRYCLQQEWKRIKGIIREKREMGEDTEGIRKGLLRLEEEICRAEKEEKRDLYTGI